MFYNPRCFLARLLSVLVPKHGIWHACCVQLGTLGDHRAIQGDLGAQEGRPWGPGVGFCRFCVDLGTAVSELLANFGTRNVFFVMCVYRTSFVIISGSEAGCLGLQNQAFGVRGVAKTSFSHMWGFG